MAFLEVNSYKKRFGDTEVLKGISFELEKGEVLAIIGSSGGGKTTLLRCLNFLEMPDEGELRLNGETLFDAAQDGKHSEKTIRKKRLHFGLVFQSFHLFPQYTVLRNVELAQLLQAKEMIATRKKQSRTEYRQLVGQGKETLQHVEGVERKERKKEILAARKEWKVRNRFELAELRRSQRAEIAERSLALLERVGLADKAENYPYQLSGGQQQRVAIARALGMHPDILCFDEPTSALDPELTGEVLKVIRGLKNSDSTMIVVTHEMNFARSVADKILFLDKGEAAEFGTPEEVFERSENERIRAFLSKLNDE